VPDPALQLKKIGFKDDNVTIADGPSATFAGGNPVARFNCKLTVPQYRCYHVSVMPGKAWTRTW